MLYLLRADGFVETLADAVRAVLDDENDWLICYDEAGREVARYPKLSVTMYSDKPLPTAEQDAEDEDTTSTVS